MRNLRTIFCSLLTAVCVVRAAPEADAERLQLADGLYSRGMYGLAAREYEAFLLEFPDSKKIDVVLFRMGESYRQEGRHVEAEKAFRRVITEFPQSEYRFQAGFKRAGLFLEAGNHEDALSLYQGVLSRKPPADMAAACLYFSGEALIGLDRKDEAVKTLEKLCASYAGSEFHAYALLKLGSLYSDDAKALKMFEDVLKQPGSDRVAAEALFQMAETYFRREEYKQSADAYRKLLTDYGSDRRAEEARLQAAWASHNAKLYAEALRTADETLVGDPAGRQADWLYLKANCERQLLRNEPAVETYDKLLKTFPDSRFADAARYERALTFYRMGKFQEAIDQALEITEKAGITQDVYWLLAESYAGLKRNDDAVQYYRLITSEFPDSEVARDATYRLAYHLQTREAFKEAARQFQTVAEKYPESPLAPQALFASGYCLSREDLYEDAVRDWSTLVRKYPADSRVEEAIFQKAMGEIRLERSDDALNSLRDLRRRYPESAHTAEAFYWEGMLLKGADKLQDAEDAYRKALQAGPDKEMEREARFHLAMVLYKLERFGDAADLFQELLASPLKDRLAPSLMEWQAEFQYGRKQYPASMAAARFLVEQTQDATWQQSGWCLIGRVHLAEGRDQEAEEALGKALTLDGKSRFAAEAALRLGDVRYRGEVYDAAESYYARAAALSSDDSLLGVRARSYAGLGRTALAREKYDEAARYFMSVAVLFNEEELVPESLYQAGQAFGRAGKEEERKKALEELTARYPDSDWAKKAASEADKPAPTTP